MNKILLVVLLSFNACTHRLILLYESDQAAMKSKTGITTNSILESGNIPTPEILETDLGEFSNDKE